MMPIEAAERLTPREREVVELVAYGMTNIQIGLRLGISENTIKRHMSNIMTKLNAANRTDVVRILNFKYDESVTQRPVSTGRHWL